MARHRYRAYSSSGCRNTSSLSSSTDFRKRWKETLNSNINSSDMEIRFLLHYKKIIRLDMTGPSGYHTDQTG